MCLEFSVVKYVLLTKYSMINLYNNNVRNWYFIGL